MPNRPAFDMAGRVAIVTGSSSGLGAHFSRVLAAAGAAVVLTARRHKELVAVAEEIVIAGGQALAVEADASNEASVVAAYDQAESAFGPVTSVVANAGVNAGGAATEMAVDDFDRLFATNVRGAFLTAREGARRLIASPAGHAGRIVLISSITAHWVVKGLAPYSASKAALNQMGRVMAKDWANHSINVNMLLPGNVRTEISQDWFDSEPGRRQLSRFPRRRLMEASDLDAMLLFLCSDASRAVTGSAFTIDDGQTL